MAEYDIFISCKSEDYEIAEKVYSFLKDNGFSVFLSSKELRRMAQADYMDAISVALDTAYSMIVISTKKEYLTSKWVKFEWSTFLNEILSGRKTGQIMTLADNIKVHEFPIQLRKYESFTLENYEDILPYLENPKKQVEPQKEVTQDVNNDRTNSAEVHIETDIPCRIMRFKEELITAQPDYDNLILLKNGTHKLTFVSIENEQDNYSQVYTVKDDCEFLQVSLAKIRDTRIAKEEAENRAMVTESLTKEETELKRIVEDDAQYHIFKENGKYGFKTDGIVVILAKYDYVRPFREGVAKVCLNGHSGFIDKTGKEVIPLKYDFEFNYSVGFNEGLAKVCLRNKCGYIDRSGKEVIPFFFEDAYDFSEGFAAVKLIDFNMLKLVKWGYIDRIGREVIPLQYEEVRSFSEGFAAVKLNDMWGYIDKTGKVVIPISFEAAYDFREGLAAVKLIDKWGYIDKTGNEAIPFKYDNAWNFSEDLAPVELDGKWGYIDKTGKVVIPFFYYFIASPFREGLAAVKLIDKWGYIDKSGKYVIPIKYNMVTDFKNGKAQVELDGVLGYIDKYGNFSS